MSEDMTRDEFEEKLNELIQTMQTSRKELEVLRGIGEANGWIALPERQTRIVQSEPEGGEK